jgi:hypothetical protein
MKKEDLIRLDKWVKKLSKKELQLILKDCIEELVITESISFHSSVPMWDNSGDYLDGREHEEE